MSARTRTNSVPPRCCAGCLRSRSGTAAPDWTPPPFTNSSAERSPACAASTAPDRPPRPRSSPLNWPSSAPGCRSAPATTPPIPLCPPVPPLVLSARRPPSRCAPTATGPCCWSATPPRSTDGLPAASPAFRPITRHSRLGTPTDPDPHTRLTSQSVALLVKQAVALLDDPTRFPPGQYAGHSLRARHPGRSAGVPLDRIMRQTRHASIAVALRYIREADIWKDNASAVLGL